MTETKYTAELWWDDIRHTSYEAPVGWTPAQIHEALQAAGFRPWCASDAMLGQATMITLLKVPPVTLLKAASDAMGYVSGIEPGPSTYSLPDADSEQTAEALITAGFKFGWEAKLVSEP